MSESPRHKVFVSYIHEDRPFVDRLAQALGGELVDGYTAHADIERSAGGTRAIRRKIRDEVIGDASVAVVLIGPSTHARPKVDWEIAASLRQTGRNSRCGLLGIRLPNHADHGRKEFGRGSIPARLADNLKGANPYAVLRDWPRDGQESRLREWIHEAHLRSKTGHPDNARGPLQRETTTSGRKGIRDRYRLTSISLNGFKTIRELRDFRPNNLTVLIGPNGAGKSNFVSFLGMMNHVMTTCDGLRDYVGREGGAANLLHDGPATTAQIEAEMTVSAPAGEARYRFQLGYAAGDNLIFRNEHHEWCYRDIDGPPHQRAQGRASPDAEVPRIRDPIALVADDSSEFSTDAPGPPGGVDGASSDSVARDLLRGIAAHHFHNTAATSRIRTRWNVNDNRVLKGDAANIAPVLLRLREDEAYYYERIVDTVRLVLPYFSDFELAPDRGHVMLAWREWGSDEVFDASQASDGMLRVVALVTLLLQPGDRLPHMLILDEPELGLHPHATEVIGGLIRSLSNRVQIIVATQSTALVDRFDPEHIVAVERRGRESVFCRLDPEGLGEWLEDYSLSELWEKNVIGGRP